MSHLLSEFPDNLGAESKSYFFKAIIDFVVYDPVDNHNPKYFFEVDSAYHDSDKAKRNDALKDDIFSIANIELIRIRPSDQVDGNRFGFETAIRTKVSYIHITVIPHLILLFSVLDGDRPF
ncbi:DUF2726 domain-containing protein [Aeromonas veronii]|uniref:DUF2726 domain-containing protein n=1 Tax=Aeromonas veronii TaxID=654 RepID=UPI003D1D5FC5